MVAEAAAAEQAARERREGAVKAEEERERIRGLSAEERQAEGRPPKSCTGCAQGCPDCERRPSASLDTEAEARARKEEAEEARRNEKLLRDVLRAGPAADDGERDDDGRRHAYNQSGPRGPTHTHREPIHRTHNKFVSH